MRVKIEYTTPFIFETKFPVRITDLNYGKHVGNDTMLSWLQEARVQFYRAFGYADELNILGQGVILADAALQFKGEAHYGQEICARVAVANFSRVGYDLFYLLVDAATGKEILRAKTGMICYDYTVGKIQKLPEVLKTQWTTAKPLAD